jgi:hypothetical protein
VPEVPDEPPLPLVPEVPEEPPEPEVPDEPEEPLVPDEPLVPELPETPIRPPGLTFLIEGIIDPGEAFPTYPRFVKVTEVELLIAFTEKYPALSQYTTMPTTIQLVFDTKTSVVDETAGIPMIEVVVVNELMPLEPDVPLVPEDPPEPDDPLEPDVPLVPEDPPDPDVPEEPPDPDVPDDPLVPEEPPDPEVPEDPDVPLEPEEPEEPLVPEEPSPPLAPSRFINQLEYVPEPTVLIGAPKIKSPELESYDITSHSWKLLPLYTTIID